MGCYNIAGNRSTITVGLLMTQQIILLYDVTINIKQWIELRWSRFVIFHNAGVPIDLFCEISIFSHFYLAGIFIEQNRQNIVLKIFRIFLAFYRPTNKTLVINMNLISYTDADWEYNGIKHSNITVMHLNI